MPLIIQSTKQSSALHVAAQAKINHAQDGATPPTKLNQVLHGQAPRIGDVHPPTKEGVAFTFHSTTPVDNQGKATLTYTMDADPPVAGTTTKQVTFAVGGFETSISKDARVAIQNLVVADFRTGIDKTQIASTGQPTKSQVISDIRHKINNQNAKVLILEGDLTITFNNSAKIVTIVINNHGPSKTITIAGFMSITDYLDQLLEAIPPSGGAFIIPEGITSGQFNDYVATRGNVVNAKGEFVMNKFAKKYQARITSLTIPDSFTSVDNWFQHFNKITSLTLGKNLQSIGEKAFNSIQLKALIIPASVTTIGVDAFQNSPLTTITIFDDVTLGEDAFKNAKQIIKQARPSK